MRAREEDPGGGEEAEGREVVELVIPDVKSGSLKFLNTAEAAKFFHPFEIPAPERRPAFFDLAARAALACKVAQGKLVGDKLALKARLLSDFERMPSQALDALDEWYHLQPKVQRRARRAKARASPKALVFKPPPFDEQSNSPSLGLRAWVEEQLPELGKLCDRVCEADPSFAEVTSLLLDRYGNEVKASQTARTAWSRRTRALHLLAEQLRRSADKVPRVAGWLREFQESNGEACASS